MAAFNLEERRKYAREWAKARRASDPAFAKRASEQARVWQKANPVSNARNQYKQNAKKRGLEYGLTNDEFSKLIHSNCHYCGIEPSPINGIDRVDSGIGYVSGNVVPACGICNYAKRTMSVAKFSEWIMRVASHLLSKGEA